LLKREDMQPVFSFKLRGAYNKMAGLTQAQLKRGVVAASAGNHAQGVALAAQVLGCEATIVMPATTPGIKVDAVAKRGATWYCMATHTTMPTSAAWKSPRRKTRFRASV
jgi:threonine dehydratase